MQASRFISDVLSECPFLGTVFFVPLFTPFSIGFVLHRYKLTFAHYTNGL